MSTVSARNAKNRFGDLLLAAQREPVVIEKNGKPVAVVTAFADHEAAKAAKLAALRRDLARADEDLSAGRHADFDDDRVAAIKGRGRLAAVLRTLQAQETRLRALGVTGAWVFGSLVRGDDRPGSDVDVLIDLDPSRRIDVMDYAWVVGEIEGLFEGLVDVAERRALRHDVAREALRDAIRAF